MFKLVAVLSQMENFEGNTGSFSFDKARPLINRFFFLYFGHLTKQAENKSEKWWHFREKKREDVMIDI